jgi:Calcium-binding EGF domain
LQLFRRRAYCVSRGNDVYETVRPFFLFRIFYANQLRGACEDLCTDICDHAGCVEDYELSAGRCTCIDNDDYLCGFNTRCTKDDECVCLAGSSGNPYQADGCSETDECLSSDNLCKAPAATGCTNTIGSYICTCSAGYEWKGVSNGGCIDINECVANPERCGPTDITVCTNTPGSYTCSCTSGYQGQSPNCTDVNECLKSPCNNRQTWYVIHSMANCQ